SIASATNILAFGDLMVLGMALPNVLGLLILSGMVRKDLDSYEAKLKAGQLKTYK
ncbi:MAG: AGCS family alanine or glycine:cation symporter, partial [Myxococcota bacterium]